ncbi:MAG: hypothetical protein QXK01_08955 [Thermofilum sp.]|uniref:hypothetical protein n=1 Tax=Thermofilum sp. TaxID=1961369 RepID=UPI00315E1946
MPVLEVEVGPHRLQLKPLGEMTEEELRDECAMWRAMFLNLDAETRWLLWLVGKRVNIILRNYEIVSSNLFRVVAEPKFLYIGRAIKRYDPVEDRYRIELVLEQLSYGNVMGIQEVVESRETEAEEVAVSVDKQ